MQAVEASLRRLQTDYLDIFQLHEPPSSVLENGEIIETLELLKSQGKIRYYGVGCGTVEDALICLRYPGFAALQVKINLLNQEGITKLLPLTKEKNVAVMARQPFASGSLFKLLGDSSKPDFSSQSKIEEKIRRIRRCQLLSEKGSRTLTQLAIQFVLQFDSVSTVVTGMRSRKHLEENLAAINAPALTQEELAALDFTGL